VRVPDIYIHGGPNWINELKIGRNCYCGRIKSQISRDRYLIAHHGGYGYWTNPIKWWRVNGSLWWVAPNIYGRTGVSEYLNVQLWKHGINLIVLHDGSGRGKAQLPGWEVGRWSAKDAMRSIESNKGGAAYNGLQKMGFYRAVLVRS
jgi:hypothetical protein